ncbi:MAG: peptidylprolyl isomerase [Clostridium sp.]|uniref:peptidylprolyl isomerase n=1 Tax=Clostridium sp. TaxID=1506 RepID=UPI003F409A5F
MGKVKSLVAIGIVALVSISIVGCKMIQKTPEAIQKEALAKVGDHDITRGDLDKAMAPTLAMVKKQYGDNFMENSQVKQQYIQMEEQTLNLLVDQQIVLQEAPKLKTMPSEADLTKQVNEQIQAMIKQFGGQEAFDNALKQENTTQAELETQIKDNIIIENTLQKAVYDTVKVTPEQAQEYYNKNKMLYTTKESGADVSHILVKTKEEADKIEAELKKDNGKNFAELAKKDSQDPGSKDKGGSLGWVPYDSTQLVEPFMNGMRTLTKDGQISAPVQSQFGWHIIKVENVKLAYQPFKDVQKTIIDTLTKQEQQTKLQSSLETWKKELDVKVYTDKLNKNN